MKSLIACLLASTLVAPAIAFAQSNAPAPARKPAAKPQAQHRQGGPSPSRAAAIKAAEETVPLEEADPSIKLSAAELEIAKRVYTGDLPCELGATVTITPLKREGFFLVKNKLNRFVMHPVESRTGALRLEDPARGAMWLQLGNKSMLMSQKLGQRLADECQSPAQKEFAEAMKNKPPVNILEPAPGPQNPSPTSKSGPN
jgi:Ni/Co efflux regulator RcnB